MNIFDERLAKLQSALKRDNIKAYVIPATDPHMSEEANAHFTTERHYFCSFEGSDGTLLVSQDEAFLFTDGRFWTEAEDELKGTKVQLIYAGKAGVKTLPEFVKEKNLYPLGLDASMFSLKDLRAFYTDGEHKLVQVSYRSLVENLPLLPQGKVWKVDPSLLSTTREERIASFRHAFEERGAKAAIVATLDDIAYLLGYRGSDIAFTPVFYSYLYLSENKKVHLFIDENKLPTPFETDIVVHPYEEFYTFLASVKDVPTFVDPTTTNARICSLLEHRISFPSPVIREKAVKGKVEIENTKKIQAIDGIAVLKLMKYIDDNIDSGSLDEYRCAEYIDDARRHLPLCFDLSFETIAACDANAAMMHYAPTKEKHAPLTRANQLLLVDSGGQYYGGTTDTTRTFIVSKHVSEQVRHDYTLTLKSQIALSTSVFEKGCSGHEIDIRAREVMWKEGLDYKCGTGHGVGYMSCVHEGPIGFRYYHREGVYDDGILAPGQVITIEPGVYKAHKYGIRLENDLLIVPAFETDDGIFYQFETITYTPYDRRGIDIRLLDDDELRWLNNYHEMVREKLLPHCKGDSDLQAYLIMQTAPIYR